MGHVSVFVNSQCKMTAIVINNNNNYTVCSNKLFLSEVAYLLCYLCI